MVHRLVGQVEAPGLSCRLGVDPLDGQVGEIGGEVGAGARHHLAIDQQGAVLVLSLPLLGSERDEQVQPAQVRQCAGHVPLADERRAVAGSLQRLEERLGIRVPRRKVVHHPVAAGVLA